MISFVCDKGVSEYLEHNLHECDVLLIKDLRNAFSGKFAFFCIHRRNVFSGFSLGARYCNWLGLQLL
jgi:hypothetical protein